MFVYFGAMTKEPDTSGLYVSKFDPGAGTLTAAQRVAATGKTLWMEFDPRTSLIYATVKYQANGADTDGGVAAFKHTPGTGVLEQVALTSSGGGTPCHLAIDPARRFLAVANYGGNIATLPLDGAGLFRGPPEVHLHAGKGSDESRQTGPHPHAVVFSPDGRHLFSADLGADKLFAYQVLDKGRIEPAPALDLALHGGAGPRHLAFHPTAPYAYVVNELDSTITVLRFDPEPGTLQTLETLDMLPGDFVGNNYPAEIRIHPNGTVLYATNRGHDSIVVFDLDPDTGLITHPHWVSSGGEYPWDARLTPDHAWMLTVNKNSANIGLFQVEEDGKKLHPVKTEFTVPDPASMLIIPEN